MQWIASDQRVVRLNAGDAAYTPIIDVTVPTDGPLRFRVGVLDPNALVARLEIDVDEDGLAALTDAVCVLLAVHRGRRRGGHVDLTTRMLHDLQDEVDARHDPEALVLLRHDDRDGSILATVVGDCDPQNSEFRVPRR